MFNQSRIVLAVLMMGFVNGLVASHSPGQIVRPRAPEPVPEEKAETSEGENAPQNMTEAHQQAEIDIVIQSMRREFRSSVHQALQDLDKIESSLEQIERFNQLRSGEDGRWISPHMDLVEEYEALAMLSDVWLDPELRGELERFLDLVEAAEEEPFSKWRPRESRDRVKTIRSSLAEHARMYADLAIASEQLVARGKERGQFSDLSLQSQLDALAGARARAYAGKLQKLKTASEQRLRELRLKEEQQMARWRHIASDVQAHRLCWWLADTRYYEPHLAEMYLDVGRFRQELAIHINRKFGIVPHSPNYPRTKETIGVENKLDAAARDKFGVSLHEVFRTLLKSRDNRKRYVLGKEQLQVLLRRFKENGDRESAAKVSRQLSRSSWLPPAVLD